MVQQDRNLGVFISSLETVEKIYSSPKRIKPTEHRHEFFVCLFVYKKLILLKKKSIILDGRVNHITLLAILFIVEECLFF